ncbi:protein HHL1, chloroplastic [Humulus lupulus]|uniref:protein HHL1, chloroplastic n=1 Tax=Humulus lupulus TaxID=3486 RepID=UPI002B416EF4|nr:protein HHL1, chloroplastic [Humulus lupulus]
MSLNAVLRLPLSNFRTQEDGLVRHSLGSSSRTSLKQHPEQRQQQRHQTLVVQAKGKKGMQERQFQRPPPMPKIEDDGNPRFVIFIRMAEVGFWYPLSVVTGGTTAKIMVAAKDNFLGKYIYKDTLARNLAAVIYRDEKEIQKSALKQFKVLRSAKNFRYGYKIVEDGNIKAALSTSDVIELPTLDKLKTVVDKVKDFFGDAKDSFGKMSSLNAPTEESEENTKEKQKVSS